MSTKSKSPRRAPQVRTRAKETLPENPAPKMLAHEWPQPWAVVDELSGLLGKAPNVEYSMACANPYANTVLSYVRGASGGLLSYKPGDIKSEYELRPLGEIALFPHQIPREVEAELLTIAGCINYPKRLTPDEARSLETPCIVKNPFMQRGEGVRLVEPGGGELRVICDQLGDGSRYPNIIIEEFIKSPGNFPVTFRVTAIPTGQVIGVTLKVGGELYDNGGYLSNVAQGGTNYPLRLTKADGQYATSVDPRHADSLARHGIDAESMEAPIDVVEEACRIAEALGRNYGVVFGIDLILGEDRRLHLLEINNVPSPDGVVINGRLMNGRPEVMYEIALQRLCGDLALRNAGKKACG